MNYIQNEKRWVGTWSASPTDLSLSPVQFEDETLPAFVPYKHWWRASEGADLQHIWHSTPHNVS